MRTPQRCVPRTFLSPPSASPSEPLTRSLVGPFDQATPADHGAGEADQAVVDVEAPFPAHGEPAELVQQGEGLFDDVAQFAETLEVGSLRLGDDRLGAALAAGLAEGAAAVSLVGQQHVEPASWPAGTSGDRRVAVEQIQPG